MREVRERGLKNHYNSVVIITQAIHVTMVMR